MIICKMSTRFLQLYFVLSIVLAAATQAKDKAEFLCDLIQESTTCYYNQPQINNEIDFTKLFVLSDDKINNIILYESTLKDVTIDCDCPVCMNNQPTTGHTILNKDYLNFDANIKSMFPTFKKSKESTPSKSKLYHKHLEDDNESKSDNDTASTDAATECDPWSPDNLYCLPCGTSDPEPVKQPPPKASPRALKFATNCSLQLAKPTKRFKPSSTQEPPKPSWRTRANSQR